MTQYTASSSRNAQLSQLDLVYIHVQYSKSHQRHHLFSIPRPNCFSGPHCSNVSSALRPSASDISRPSTGFYLISLAFWFWTLFWIFQTKLFPALDFPCPHIFMIPKTIFLQSPPIAIHHNVPPPTIRYGYWSPPPPPSTIFNDHQWSSMIYEKS